MLDDHRAGTAIRAGKDAPPSDIPYRPAFCTLCTCTINVLGAPLQEFGQAVKHPKPGKDIDRQTLRQRKLTD
jgi:hypothetical protein